MGQIFLFYLMFIIFEEKIRVDYVYMIILP